MKAFEEIFKLVQSDLHKNLAANAEGTLADSSKPMSLKGSGTIPFDFHLDGNGNYQFKTAQYGAGVTVHASAWVDRPEATYTITVTSSDGGGGHWENVHANQKLYCDIHTSFWHKTNIQVDIHASVKNVDGHGTIEYRY